MSVEQLRAARAMLGWTQRELADRSDVSLPTIKRLEVKSGPINTRVETLRKLDRALQRAGISFADSSVALFQVKDGGVI